MIAFLNSCLLTVTPGSSWNLFFLFFVLSMNYIFFISLHVYFFFFLIRWWTRWRDSGFCCFCLRRPRSNFKLPMLDNSLILFFLFKTLFIYWERECVCARVHMHKSGGRGRGKGISRLTAEQGAQHEAWCGAWRVLNPRTLRSWPKLDA